MGNVYAYNNQLWREIYRFSYTGEPQSFTLQPGTYLLQCHGAKGGDTSIHPNLFNLGGSSFGILTLNEQKSFYAYVGGDGTRGDVNTVGIGGYNGGGNGGLGYNTTHIGGSGGGGATDIRLKRPEDCAPIEPEYFPTLPEGYQQLEYIESDGNQYFETGYALKTNSVVSYECAIPTPSTSDQQTKAIFGSERNVNGNPGWTGWIVTNYNSDNPLMGCNRYGNMNYSDSILRKLDWDFETRGRFVHDQWGFKFNNARRYFNNTDMSPGSPWNDGSANSKILLLATRRNTNPDEKFIGKLYYLRIYETNNMLVPILVHEYVPCKYNDTVGLYDTVAETFLTPVISSSIPLTGGPEGSYQLPYNDLRRDVLQPELPEGYTPVEYIEGTGDQYIDTGYKAKTTDEIFLNVELLPRSGSAYEWMCGYQKTTPYRYLYSSANDNYNYYVIYGRGDEPTGALDVRSQSSTGDTSNSRWITMYTYHGYTYALYNTGLERARTGSGVGWSSAFADLSFYLFSYNPGNGDHGVCAHMKLHGGAFYADGDTLIHCYVPCYRNIDNVAGLYDVMTDEFLTNANESSASDFTIGPTISQPLKYCMQLFDKSAVDPTVTKSLNTRIMVAGGGGGGSLNYPSYSNGSLTFTGIGGGTVGGITSCHYSATSSNAKYASQSAGYQIGQGANASKKTRYSMNGASGGGGGWFGGYAIGDDSGYSDYMSGNGGGGSGYVLTELSQRITGYDDNGVLSDYYMTNPFMNSGTALNSIVSISQLTTTINTGDVIIIQPTGSQQSFVLPPGTFQLECWGGDGGVHSTPVGMNRGGYARGILQTDGEETYHVNVGGTGMYDNLVSQTYVFQLKPDLSWNGGGSPPTYGTSSNTYLNGRAGGGATDIRVGSDDSVYSRIIVAGGSGGACKGGFGGAGGGEVGGNQVGSAGYNAGPGTQTGAGNNTSYPGINGGFGYGGNGYMNRNYDYLGGAGGSGWYGGSGTYPDQSSGQQYSGAGGSGYVLTADSFKPEGYIPSEDYYLTNTVLTQGGNDLPYGVTRAEITALAVSNYRVLCRDMYGIKYWDTDESRWALTSSQELSPELFNAFGSFSIASDEGLADDYEVLLYDPDNVINQSVMNITPNKQTVTCDTISDMPVRDMTPELDFDPSLYDIDITARRQISSSNVKIHTEITIDKKDRTNQIPKLYYIIYSSDR